MSFLSFFGKVGKVLISPVTASKACGAGALVSLANPGLGAFIELIANAAYTVETSVPAGTPGSDKKDAVKGMIDMSAPVVVSVLDQVAGKVIDPAAVAPAIDRLIDDVVGLFNAMGVFSHKPATPAK